MQAKIDLIQAFLDGKVKRANALDTERVELLIPEKSLNCQL